MFKIDTIKRNAFVLFIGLTILMLWTSCLMPLTWDEGNAIIRSEKIAKWVTFFLNCPPGISSPFDYEVIQKYCEQTTQTEGHPAGYVLLIAAGNNIVRTAGLECLLDEKTCYRFGPILLFCIALTAVFLRVGKTFGQTAGMLCLLCIIFMPRVFAHAHIAACDSPLMSCWLLACTLFDTALKNKRGAILWGIVIGLGFSMKFPGWIIPIPFLIFAALELIRRQPTDTIARAFAVGFPTAVFVFYLLNPNLWYEPIEGFLEFFRMNTHRTGNLNIASVFFGQLYYIGRPLPWYNTLVWAGITIPVALLFFLLWLIISSVQNYRFSIQNKREHNQLLLLILLNALPLMIIRSIPGTPVHNGVRLFVAAFPFIGILAGLGAARLWSFPWLYQGKRIESLDTIVINDDIKTEKLKTGPTVAPNQTRLRCLLFQRLLVCVLLCGAGFNLYWYESQWLSYYNICIGGLPGAVRSGMEATYYWDALDDKTMNWINDHCVRDEQGHVPADQFLFHCCSPQMLETLHRWKKIKSGIPISSVITEQSRFIVIQRLDSALVTRPLETKLIQEAKPVYQKVIPRHGFGPWNLCEVPLIEIYDAKDFIAIVIQSESQNDKNSEPKQWTPW